MKQVELRCTAAREGRLSSFLRGELKMSTGLMNKLKWGSGIQVNGQPRHTDYRVQPGDIITVLLDDPEPEYPAEEGPLEILYEDEHLLAVDKPAGLLIHPSRNRISGTLANYVVGYYQRTGQKSAFHPITRLDRDTMGVVLLAKNSHVHARMQQLPIEKVYHALVFGGPREDAGVIDAPIARRELPSLLREIRADGKPSRTEYAVLERRDGHCLLELKAVTGRTHQLRLHCAHRGFPILGDPQYGSCESAAFSVAWGLESQLLCAQRLTFCHPITGAPVTIRSQRSLSLTFPGGVATL